MDKVRISLKQQDMQDKLTSENKIKKDSVAVIIPVHNRWPIICDAIDSVLIQSYPSVECVVVDDASTDGTSSLLKEKYGNKIRVLTNKENREKSYSRNRGVREARSEYICFLDSDDVFTEQSISSRMEVFKANPSFEGVSFGLCSAMNAKNDSEQKVVEYLKENTPYTLDSYLNNKKTICTNSFLLKRKAMLKYGMYDERLTNREDIELYVRLLIALPFIYSESPVGHVRSVAEVRARNLWRKILNQQAFMCDAFYQVAKNHPKYRTDISRLVEEGNSELLTALYHGLRYDEYLLVFKALSQFGERSYTKQSKYKKRYMISFLLRFMPVFSNNLIEKRYPIRLSLIDTSNKRYKVSIGNTISYLTLEGSGIDDLVEADLYDQFLSKASVIKCEKNRKIFRGLLSNGQEIFCKIQSESGVYAFLKWIFSGPRINRARNQSLKFEEIGLITPKSLGYICRKVGFLKWECLSGYECIDNNKKAIRTG